MGADRIATRREGLDMTAPGTTATQAAPDHDQLMALLGKIVVDAGGTLVAGLVRTGEKLGLFRGLAEGGPQNSTELAERTATSERYVREWLCALAASGYVSYDPTGERFSLTLEQELAFADSSSPVYCPGLFELVTSVLRDEPKITEAFQSGRGVGWHEHDHGLFTGTERFFRSGYAGNLIASWIPSLTGVEARLREGATVADIGCGHGASTILMAQAFPASRFVGFDYHAPSIDVARKRAADAGLGDRATFEVAPAASYPGTGYDLVTSFDCLHDMGDPVGAAKHVHGTLAPDGVWMIVEPFAGDRVEDNLNPVGRLFYSASTLICTPASLSQEVGLALGAQAGEARLAEVIAAGGFTRFRRATETPFNLVLEARA
jgi:SAM-dependent methyltransferase